MVDILDETSVDVKELNQANEIVEEMADILDETLDDVKDLDHDVKETINIFKLDQALELHILSFDPETSNDVKDAK